jgi:hypothetical protein
MYITPTDGAEFTYRKYCQSIVNMLLVYELSMASSINEGEVIQKDFFTIRAVISEYKDFITLGYSNLTLYDYLNNNGFDKRSILCQHKVRRISNN